MKRSRAGRTKGAGKPEAPPIEPAPEGHATDEELFALECAECEEEPWHRAPISTTYIRARRRIYNLGREHGAKGKP